MMEILLNLKINIINYVYTMTYVLCLILSQKANLF